jgi:cytochrome P450
VRTFDVAPTENFGYPVIRGLSALSLVSQYLRDPLAALRHAHAAYGPIVAVGSPLPFLEIRKSFILTAGAEFNRDALSDPATWRPWHIFIRGPRKSALRRLGTGIIRMTGRRHAHYRRLLMQPLRKDSVEALGTSMSRLAVEEVSSWPIGQPLDLWSHTRRLMQTFAIGLLFGDDRQHGYPIAGLLTRLLEFNWSPRVAACPINLPQTTYGRLLRHAEVTERRILDWADCKRGPIDNRDLLSIVVNSPDEDGNSPTDDIVAGHIPTLFGAAYETCQNVMIWTLILIAQHPSVARELLDELRSKLHGAPLSLDKMAELPFLDAIVKESMRLLPPVPLQIREAIHETNLAGRRVPKGARVVLNGFLTNRMPSLYAEPDCFRPERWATISPSPFEYSAFSAGPRKCPGSLFGMSVVKIALAEILTRYRVALAPDARIDYQVRIALSPRGHVPVMLHRQDGNFAAATIHGSIRNLVRFPEQ